MYWVLHLQYLVNDRQAKKAEIKRLQQELTASQLREEKTKAEAKALQALARQIDRRNQAAERGKAAAEASLQQAQQLLQKSQLERRKCKQAESKWRDRCALAGTKEGDL